MNVFFDPLDQFSIINFLFFYMFNFNNILLILIINVIIIILYFLLFIKSIKIITNFLSSFYFIYNFFNIIIRENLRIEKQIFTPFLFLIFIFILFSNIVGMIPYNLTITSYLVITFFFCINGLIRCT